jgi:putative colanic acid biosynthesis UDP-glucose lipid carrier transferase
MARDSFGISTHKASSILVFRGIDFLAIVAGLLLTRSYRQSMGTDQIVANVAAAFLCYSLAGEFTGAYRSWRGSSLFRELVCTWWTLLLGLGGLLVVGAATQFGSGLTRLSFAAWTLMTCLSIGLGRSTLRFVQTALRGYGINTKGFAIAGISDIGIQLAKNILDSPHLGLRLVGFFDDRPAVRTVLLPPEFSGRSGTLDDLLARTRSGEVSVVYVTFPMRAEVRIRDVLNRFADTTASVYLVPDFFVFELLHSRWNNILGVPVVSVFENPFYGVDGILKRTLDVVLGSILLSLAAAPMLAIAFAIKWSSAGSVFFRQRRYGLDGREIRVWKFRTMTVCEDGAAVQQAAASDPRVTKLGAFLRRTSLDELPQLFNVLSGSMSLVGPRPHATSHNEQYRTQIHGYMLRHKVRPGITGLAQVNGWRGETDTLYKMERRIEFDHRYIREWSLWLDLRILLQTIVTVFSGKNAH